jgi:hypothetical protein
VFLDLVVFSATIKSRLSTTASEAIKSTMTTLGDWIEVSGASNAKFLRAKVSLETSSVTSGQSDEVEKHRRAVRADMLATEKLRLLRSRNPLT